MVGTWQNAAKEEKHAGGKLGSGTIMCNKNKCFVDFNDMLWNYEDINTFIYSLAFFTIYGYIANSKHDQPSDGLIAHLVKHCTGIAEVMGSKTKLTQIWPYKDADAWLPRKISLWETYNHHWLSSRERQRAISIHFHLLKHPVSAAMFSKNSCKVWGTCERTSCHYVLYKKYNLTVRAC